MRLTDLVVFPIAALWQQKTRSLLTTLGVAFGAFVLAASMSIGHGVQETIVRESRRTDALRRIAVYPSTKRSDAQDAKDKIVVEGKMSEEKRERIRSALADLRAQSSTSEGVLLNEDMLAKLATIPHVQAVEPQVSVWDFAIIDGHAHQVFIESSTHYNSANLRRLVAGNFYGSPNEPAAVVSEFLLYRCGIVDDDEVEGIVGGKLKLELHSEDADGPTLRAYLHKPGGAEVTREEYAAVASLSERLPTMIDRLELTPGEFEILRRTLRHSSPNGAEAQPIEGLISEEFTIAGVVRRMSDEERENRRWWEPAGGTADVLLPDQTAARFLFRSPAHRRAGLYNATLLMDSEERVKAALEQVKAMGLNGTAPIEFIEREQLIWRLVFGGMTLVALVALLVAGMGIANTMLMSVIERTREIGIMKSLGASPAHIQTFFLIEGALIGVAGAALGVFAAWAAAFPGDAWVRRMVERDMSIQLTGRLFVFPPWLVALVVGFSVAVTVGAAYYPARRASRIDPVAALRHD